MLTEAKIKSSKSTTKDYKLSDEKGLYLLVTTKGNKYWRYDYRYKGKRKTISLGVYPDVSLKDARLLHEEYRKLLREGIDPSNVRKKEKQTNQGITLFNDIADKWFEDNKNKWVEGYSRTIRYRINVYIKNTIGNKAITEINRKEILELLKNIDKTGRIETAKRVKLIISSIYQYAIDLEITDKDPTIGIAKHMSPSKLKHYPTILTLPDVAKLIKNIDNYWGNEIVKSAMKILMLTFVRPGELRLAEWKEFDLTNGIWDIPAERMKMKKPHRVFLSRQAVEILNNLIPLSQNSKYVFRGRDTKRPISNISINRALQTLGYNTKEDITAHGFRAMARTLISEHLRYPPEVIEHQLAHKVPDKLGEAYNRTKFYEERKKMMQDWADFLDEVKEKRDTRGVP